MRSVLVFPTIFELDPVDATAGSCRDEVGGEHLQTPWMKFHKSQEGSVFQGRGNELLDQKVCFSMEDVLSVCVCI